MKKSMKKQNIFDVKLDPEEQEILESVERGEWKTVENFEQEMAFAKEAAANFFRKDARITLRISSSDLDRLKRKAAYKGLPYQTFIASVLHEYAAGHFVEAA
jgi:predicted DNA binding CopG/RHH family protein